MDKKYIGDVWTVSWGDILSETVIVSYHTGGELTQIAAAAPNGNDGPDEYSGKYDWTINLESNTENVTVRVADSNDSTKYVEFGPFDIEERVITSITVSPSAARVAYGRQRQFNAIARDQEGLPLLIQPEFTWSVNVGAAAAINQLGLLTAGEVEEEVTVTATVGEISGTATVTVLERIGSARNKSNLHISIAITT